VKLSPIAHKGIYLLTLPVLLLVTLAAKAQEFTITGEYQGKNIYVQNPLSPDKVNFCTQSVYLNDSKIIDQPKTSAYEIKLDHMAIGDPVVIRVEHRSGCKPKIINPQVIRSKSKFQFTASSANENSISWSTEGEQPNGKFFIEHFRNDKWIVINTLPCKGAFEANQYSVAPKHHSGENKYRIKYVQSDGKVFYTRIFDFYNNEEPISFYPTRVTDKITLSRATDYEVLDTYGNVVTKGYGKELALSSLEPGLYYLNIDNRTEKFVKK